MPMQPLPSAEPEELRQARAELARERAACRGLHLKCEGLQLRLSSVEAEVRASTATIIAGQKKELDSTREQLTSVLEQEKKQAAELKALRDECKTAKKTSNQDRAPADFRWADTRLPPSAAFKPPAGLEVVSCKSKSIKGKKGLRRKETAVTDEVQAAIDITVKLKKRDAGHAMNAEQRKTLIQHAVRTRAKASVSKNPDDGSDVYPYDVCELGRVAANNETMLITDVLEVIPQCMRPPCPLTHPVPLTFPSLFPSCSPSPRSASTTCCSSCGMRRAGIRSVRRRRTSSTHHRRHGRRHRIASHAVRCSTPPATHTCTPQRIRRRCRPPGTRGMGWDGIAWGGV